MTPGQALRIANIFLELNWDAIFGIAIAVVFLTIGFRLWLRHLPRPAYDEKGDPWVEAFRKYRPMLVGTVAVILGCWAAGGASELGSGLWGLFTFLVFVGAFVKVVWWIRDWHSRVPLAGQWYHVKGIGEVLVINRTGDTPLDARVRFRDAAGTVHKTTASELMARGTLLDREVEASGELLNEGGQPQEEDPWA